MPKHSYAYDLDENNILTRFANGICERTGLKFDLTVSSSERLPFAPSVDRIDSSGGYTQDNVQVVCWIYNWLKSTSMKPKWARSSRR